MMAIVGNPVIYRLIEKGFVLGKFVNEGKKVCWRWRVEGGFSWSGFTMVELASGSDGRKKVFGIMGEKIEVKVLGMFFEDF